MTFVCHFIFCTFAPRFIFSRSMAVESSRKAYLCLLRSALWNSMPEIDFDFDWNDVLQIAENQSTLPIVCQSALQLGGDNAPSLKLRSAMLGNMGQNSRQYALLNDNMMRAIGHFRAHGIEPVLLKGNGLAQNYPFPEFRQCGDIDIYVGPENYHEGCAAMREMTDFHNWGIENERDMHYNIDKGDIIIETHRVTAILHDADADAFYQKISLDGLSKDLHRVEFDGFSLNLPSDTYNAFYVFHHAWHHFLDTGVGFRQFCDWTLLLHALNGKIDLLKLKSYIDGLGLMKAWKTFACIAVEQLGLPKEEMPFYDASYSGRAAKVLDYIWLEGNFAGAWVLKEKGRINVFTRLINGIRNSYSYFPKQWKVSPSLAVRETAKTFRFYLRKLPKYVKGELK